MLRRSSSRFAVAVFSAGLIGSPALVTGPADASSGPTAPAVPAAQFRAVPPVPIVVGPTPARPSLVPATPRTGGESLRAFSATSSFVVNYDAGFDANPAAKAAFQYAVDQWSNAIASSVPIVVDATFSALPPGVLGSAGPVNVSANFTGRPIANTWYPIALANALNGNDLDAANPDIDATFSSSYSGFYFGTDGNTAGKLDFASVVLHEIGHGLGFLGAYTVGGGIGDICCGLGAPLAYDRFTSSNGQALDELPTPSAALGNALQSQNVQFSGPQTLAAGFGAAILYAPASWQGGSSYSHLNEFTYNPGNPNSLMTPAIGVNEVIHSPGPLTLGILGDTGWSVSTQPVLSVAPAGIVEGNANTRNLRFNVSLSFPAPYPISVNYQTASKTANSTDYSDRAGTVVLPAGSTTTTVAVGVRGDGTVEPNERFIFRLSGAAGAVLGTASVSGAILNDDASGDPQLSVGSAAIVEGKSGSRKLLVMVSLSKKSASTVTARWATSAATATAGSDYTETSGTVSFAPGYTDRPIAIKVLADSSVEANEYFRITLTLPTGATIRRTVGYGTINNDD